MSKSNLKQNPDILKHKGELYIDDDSPLPANWKRVIPCSQTILVIEGQTKTYYRKVKFLPEKDMTQIEILLTKSTSKSNKTSCNHQTHNNTKTNPTEPLSWNPSAMAVKERVITELRQQHSNKTWINAIINILPSDTDEKFWIDIRELSVKVIYDVCLEVSAWITLPQARTQVRQILIARAAMSNPNQ